MNVTALEKSKDNLKVSFLVKGIDAAYANALRKTIIDEVPTMSIEDVEFKKNNSVLYDEMVAHRLGLIPLETDLKSYFLKENCKCEGKGCARCELQLTLSSKKTGLVCAESIKSKDPKVKPVHDKMPVVKLEKGQDIELMATAILGKGKDHIKWSPGWVYYKKKPMIKINKQDCTEAVLVCPEKIFEQKNDKVSLNQDKIMNCQLCNACVDACGKDKVTVETSDDEYVFYVESWGQLKPKQMVLESIEILQSKLKELEKTL